MLEFNECDDDFLEVLEKSESEEAKEIDDLRRYRDWKADK